MKRTTIRLNILLLTLTAALHLQAQQVDSTGLPGDHFSLEGALDLFKNAENPEAFEKALNSEENYVNNLDLNGDGEIDYLRVVDNMEDDVHAVVLQALVGEDDSQDVAVIEIEKTGDNEAILQIIGDEDIYGEEVIIEPYEEEDGKGGPYYDYGSARLVVNVWLWPSVRYVYRPGYRIWVSPWRWSYYPTWWRPWRVRPFHRLVIARPRYHIHYHPVHIHRVGRAHGVYAPRRTTSVTVHNHYNTRVSNYRNQRGIVNTKKTTVVSGPRGGKTVIQREKTTVGGRNQNGTAGRVSRAETKVVHKSAGGERTAVSKKTTKVGGKRADGAKVRASRTTTKTKKTNVKKTKKSPRRH